MSRSDSFYEKLWTVGPTINVQPFVISRSILSQKTDVDWLFTNYFYTSMPVEFPVWFSVGAEGEKKPPHYGK